MNSDSNNSYNHLNQQLSLKLSKLSQLQKNQKNIVSKNGFML